MPRYIDADALRDALYEADAITMKGVRILNQFPTISPDEVRGVGEWKTAMLDHESFGVRPKVLYCSECNLCIAYPTKFCPSCGAKMKGGAD